jgi:hypothetical protein
VTVWGCIVSPYSASSLCSWVDTCVTPCPFFLCCHCQVRGRLTVQEGRNVQYTGIVHAARTILREVRSTGGQAISLYCCLKHTG